MIAERYLWIGFKLLRGERRAQKIVLDRLALGVDQRMAVVALQVVEAELLRADLALVPATGRRVEDIGPVRRGRNQRRRDALCALKHGRHRRRALGRDCELVLDQIPGRQGRRLWRAVVSGRLSPL